MMKELLRCPFCGSEAVRVSYKTKETIHARMAIECIKCEATTREFGNHSDAQTAWNKRVIE